MSQPKVNVTVLETPCAVVIVTGTEADGANPVGTVTVQVDCVGQSVEAAVPPKLATICPLVLRKFPPEIWTVCPVFPDAGLSEEITGAVPVMTTGAEVVVVAPVCGETAGPLA
jgi:hypothetical protein